MTILEHEVRSLPDAKIVGLHRHLFTRDAYYAMAAAGVFDNSRVELIEGEIIEMAPIGDPHAATTDPLAHLLKDAFGDGYTVRTQAPVALGGDVKPSDPQPDIAVVIGQWRDYIARKPAPADIVLIVEIADSSLAADRAVKGALYAAAGIPEYWIVNLVDGQVEVYREPSDSGYMRRSIETPGSSITPLSAPSSTLNIAEFMP